MAVFNFTPWADALVARVQTLWQKEGLTATEIGELIGKSRNAVLGKLNRMGLVGDGSHQPGVGGHHRKPKKFAPPKEPTSRSRAKGAGRLTPFAAPPPPPPLLPLKPSVDGWTGVAAAIDSLESDECHWPLPDGPVPATGFCGAPVAPRTPMPYCPHHYWHATHYIPAPYDGIPNREKF